LRIDLPVCTRYNKHNFCSWIPNQYWRPSENRKSITPTSKLREIYFWLLSNWKEYDRSDRFPFGHAPNRIQFGLKLKGKRSLRSEGTTLFWIYFLCKIYNFLWILRVAPSLFLAQSYTFLTQPISASFWDLYSRKNNLLTNLRYVLVKYSRIQNIMSSLIRCFDLPKI